MTERHRGATQHGRDERRVPDPAGRVVPFVEGPTGPAPIASELRGDPDRETEAGAAAGTLGGTALAGPVGGVVGAIAGGAVGAAADAPPDDGDDRQAPDEDSHAPRSEHEEMPPPYSVPGSTIDNRARSDSEGKGR